VSSMIALLRLFQNYYGFSNQPLSRMQNLVFPLARVNLLRDCCSKARCCKLFQTTTKLHEPNKSLRMDRMKHKCSVDIQALQLFQRCVEWRKILTEPGSLVSSIGGHAQNGQDESFVLGATEVSSGKRRVNILYRLTLCLESLRIFSLGNAQPSFTLAYQAMTEGAI
jgi:hypothetical protein